MLRSFSIKARLGMTMALLAVLLIVLGALGVAGMTRTGDALRETYANHLAATVALGKDNATLARTRAILDRVVLHPESPDADKVAARARNMIKDANAAWTAYLALPRGAEEQRLADDVARRRTEFFDKGMEPMLAAIDARDRTAMDELTMNALPKYYAALTAASDALAHYKMTLGRETYEASMAELTAFRWVSIGATVVGVLLAVACYFSLRGAIMRPLAEALAHFEQIAAGHLDNPVHVRGKDEMSMLMRGLETMQSRLASTIRGVRRSCDAMATATAEISAGNTDLSARTEQQAASLEETASSMEELTATVKQNADNARQASQLAVNASDIAARGAQVVERVVETMQGISASSTQVVDIIGVIDGIAFQTNILALNAAVEAARAGEQGRGFAVVAGEVRTLAQRSATAAREIKALIETSAQKVSDGSSLVAEAGRTMDDILQAVQRVTDIMGEISAASDEQSGGIEQVNQAVTQMDTVTQQNAALVEQAAAAAASLEDQTAALREEMARFRLGDERQAGAGAARAALHAVGSPPLSLAA
ncbi:Tar ligand binding domain-containing protein [Pandoraea nosoerga]|uniref:Membrane protein n=1 Tax=Pandoraea nosoerga TaxID=2508296 RepID=A0A5E4V986_9BURK|nr:MULTISPECIES: methyl-accepting chemotaxis protein [Pandoraea]MBN4665789.1 Tar ligand binding domain-containing protein [Pandoraea nosoerga]MBN4677243.1 Tar ligand binding domain-containing protein [Pandoraea nosoerga]MBN4681104.1 Tar ligand binding domain-containing protein [Pandoraea nosoerga]MBN4746403.1 Tar ligand binding domain-containing protein [Pandoraea nosoerga]VVE08154.1 membrane protein [Pandoraea nosoerga]